MHWYLEFERWYIGLFLMGFGLWMYLRGDHLSAARRYFKPELRDAVLKERFLRAIARREELEGDTSIAWRIAALFSGIFGALVLLRVLPGIVGYALLCMSFAAVLSQIYVNMRNRGERRAASLTPRSATSAVPALWYAGALVTALLPLALFAYPRLRVASVIVSLACVVIVLVAARAAEMAALLAGDDPEIEVYVDKRLRCARVTGLLGLCYAVSFVFIAMGTPELRQSTPYTVGIQVASWVLGGGFVIWATLTLVRGRMRSEPRT